MDIGSEDVVEVVKPDISSSNTEKRISPTKPNTTSAAAVLMLYTAGKAWGTMLSHGMSSEDIMLDEMLDEIVEELRTVLLTRVLSALKLCCVFDARESS